MIARECSAVLSAGDLPSMLLLGRRKRNFVPGQLGVELPDAHLSLIVPQ